MEEKTYVEGFHDPESVKKMTYNDFGNTGKKRILTHLLLNASFWRKNKC